MSVGVKDEEGRKEIHYITSTETVQLIKVFSDNQTQKWIQQSAVTWKSGGELNYPAA